MSQVPGRQGLTVALVTPSSTPDPAKVDEGVGILEAAGHRVGRVGGPEGYPRVGDHARAESLTAALTDASVDVVWAVRGGYGILRLLDLLPWAEIARATPKALVGFSDVTNLLMAMHRHTRGWRLVHGPNVTTLPQVPREDLEATMACCKPGPWEVEFHLEGLAGPLDSVITGPIMAGNLCTLSHMVGTGHLPDMEAAILVLEDVGEPGYRLDRMLTQLQLSGWLSGARAVVLGGILDREGRPDRAARDAVVRWFRERAPHLPLLGGAPTGHGRHNTPLVLAAAGVITPDLTRGGAGMRIAPAAR